MPNQTIADNSKNLFITFLSPARFYANPLRSFLQYLQKRQEFPRLTDFPANLYTASEALTEDYQPLNLVLQLSDNHKYPVVININPTESEDLSKLTLNLGDREVAEDLVGEGVNENRLTWLIDLLSTGATTLRADVAFISWESQANETVKAKLESGILNLENLPLILWTTASLSEEMTNFTRDAWQVTEKEDGAWLIITQSLLKNNPGESNFLWFDASQKHFFLLPQQQKLPKGNFVIYNLNGEERKVELTALTAWEVSEQDAKNYFQAEVYRAIEEEEINFSLSEPRQELSNPLKLFADILNITPEEVKNNPQKAKVGLCNLFAQLREIIEGSTSENAEQFKLSQQKLLELQKILKTYGLETGENLKAQFPQFTPTNSQISSLRENNRHLKEFAHLINSPSTSKKASFQKSLLSFVKTYQKLFGKDEEKEQKQRQQEYKERANQAIKESLSKVDLPSLQFEDLLDASEQQQE